MDFDKFVDDIRENNWNVYGVEVYENFALTHSYGDTKGGIYDIFSATKSVTLLSVEWF